MARTPTYNYFGPKKLGLTQAQDWQTFAPKNTAYDLLRQDMIASGKWTEQSHPTLVQQYQNLGLDQLTQGEINELHPNVPLNMVPATHQISQILETESLAKQGVQPGTTFAKRTPLDALNIQRSGNTDNGLFVAQAQENQQEEVAESESEYDKSKFMRRSERLIDNFINRNFSHIGHAGQIRFAARKVFQLATENFTAWTRDDNDYSNDQVGGFVYFHKSKGYTSHIGKINTNPPDGVAGWGGGAGGNKMAPPKNVVAHVIYHPIKTVGGPIRRQQTVEATKAANSRIYGGQDPIIPRIVIYQAYT